MTDTNLPWKHSHLKYRIGYRKWESIKHFKDQYIKRQLLDSCNLGKKILFIHIPKTAGVSLIKTYESSFAEARHTPALFYKILLGSQYKNFLTFSIVRNPWAKAFSAYNFLMKGGLSGTDPGMGRILKNECPSFEVFIKEWLPKNGVCCYMHFVPQHEFICGWGNDLIVDNIIKLEKLNDGWPDVADKLCLPALKLPRENISSKNDYRNYYDNESVDVVSELYKKDIDLLEYSYE